MVFFAGFWILGILVFILQIVGAIGCREVFDLIKSLVFCELLDFLFVPFFV